MSFVIPYNWTLFAEAEAQYHTVGCVTTRKCKLSNDGQGVDCFIQSSLSETYNKCEVFKEKTPFTSWTQYITCIDSISVAITVRNMIKRDYWNHCCRSEDNNNINDDNDNNDNNRIIKKKKK